jgi:hypothetical protein
LRTGTFQTVYATGDVYAFSRRLDQQEAVVIFNVATSAITRKIKLPDIESDALTQVWSPEAQQTYQVRRGRLEITLPPREAVVLMREVEA